jgi:methyl-accepting chemotaxis protein
MDLSSIGMIGLSISGLMIIFYRQKIKRNKLSKETPSDDEQVVDNIINISDSIDDISSNSQSIHDMVEHISIHLEKCKSIYSISREKDEIETIGKHISTLDGKIHHLIDNIDEFAKLTHGFGSNRSSPLDSPKEQITQNRTTEERSSEHFINPKTKPRSTP